MNNIAPTPFRQMVADFRTSKTLPHESDRVLIHPDEAATRRQGLEEMLDGFFARDNGPQDENPAVGVYERDLAGTNARMRVEMASEDGNRAASMALLAKDSDQILTPYTYLESNGQDSFLFSVQSSTYTELPATAYVFSPSAGYILNGTVPQPE